MFTIPPYLLVNAIQRVRLENKELMATAKCLIALHESVKVVRRSLYFRHLFERVTPELMSLNLHAVNYCE